MRLDVEEILKCLCFVILGYFVAMIFGKMCSCGNGYKNGFNVGADGAARCGSCNANECNDGLECTDMTQQEFNTNCSNTTQWVQIGDTGSGKHCMDGYHTDVEEDDVEEGGEPASTPGTDVKIGTSFAGGGGATVRDVFGW